MLADRSLNFAINSEITREHSLSGVARRVARLIEATLPGQVRLLPREDKAYIDLSRVSQFERAFTADLLARPPIVDDTRIVIAVDFPLKVPEHTGGKQIAFLMWEDYPLPQETVAIINTHFDALFTKSHFNARCFVNSGVVVPIHVLGYSPDLDDLRKLRAQIFQAEPKNEPFTFLHVSTCNARKGADALLRAYLKAFRRSDNVRLVIKTNPPDKYNRLPKLLAGLPANDPDQPRIDVIWDNLDRNDILGLYASADVIVLPTRGEGYNLPAAEAMAAGIPLIVTDYSAHLDFCDAETVRLVDYRFAPSGHDFNHAPYAVWVEPDVDDLVAAMREAASQPRAVAERRSGAASRRIADETDPDRFMRRMIAAAHSVLASSSSTGPLRILWIAGAQPDDELAAYSAGLLAHFPKHSTDCNITVARCTNAPANSAAAERCDIVVIQHRPDVMGWTDLMEDLRLLAIAGRVVVVGLHESEGLLALPAQERRAVVAALAGVARILVHGVADLNRLKSVGLIDNVTMIPHGVESDWPVRRDPRAPQPWRRGRTWRVGFCGGGKPSDGLMSLITAAALLRRDGIDLALRVVDRGPDSQDRAEYLASCREVAAQAGLADAIDFQTGAMTDETATVTLSECDVIVLPTQDSPVSACARARLALCAGVPVLVTPLELFDEFGPAVVRLPGRSAQAIAEGLHDFLVDLELRIATQRTAQRWLNIYAWRRMAPWIFGVLKSLSRQPGMGATMPQADET